MKNLIESLHPLERKIIPFLKNNSTLQDLKKSSLSETEITRALQWLENKQILKIKKEKQEIIELDKNGLEYTKKGLPEKQLLILLKTPLTIPEIKQKSSLSNEEINISLGLLKKKSAIKIDQKISLTSQAEQLLKKETLEERFLKSLPLSLPSLTPEQKYSYQELKKRKQIIKTTTKKELTITLTSLGEQLTKQKLETNLIETLTPDIIKNYKNQKFRRYNVTINVPKIYGGKRHIVNQSISYIKKIWLELGFKEMQGSIIQTAFWDLDALFVPQDHSARDMQDTFYLDLPKGKLPELQKIIKQTHESGWTTGSKGWQYPYNEDQAKEILLRTHTTVLSAQTINKLKLSDLPQKFFSVGKVYRNEALTWKSLFEFYQVEGIVIDENANFRNLIGYLKEFFKKLGYEKIRIRPAHFPYTEPSAEIDIFHPIKKTWIELGGSGIFRPEVTKPLLGKEIPVLAWGLGLERSIMEYYNIKDIRDLYKNDLKFLKEAKIWLK